MSRAFTFEFDKGIRLNLYFMYSSGLGYYTS
jgi:hypothetical protein